MPRRDRKGERAARRLANEREGGRGMCQRGKQQRERGGGSYYRSVCASDTLSLLGQPTHVASLSGATEEERGSER